jgi:glycosyltransferase involved in cell wall biosynthesis
MIAPILEDPALCFSRDQNDHAGYPLSAVEDRSLGWGYRPTQIELDPRRGRPWARFEVRAGEIIHASSLLPTNESPWIFDTDHAEYLVAQAVHDRATWFRDRLELEGALARSLLSPWCRGIFGWSQAARRSLLALFERQGLAPPKIHVVYPAVVPLPAQPREPREGGDAPRPGPVQLLAVDGQKGVCHHQGRKNLRDAAECFRVLRRQGLDVELLLVGPTEPIAVEPGMRLLPPVSRSEMRRLLGRADILLFLSRQDSFGMVLYEALAGGVACVASFASSLVAVPELICDGHNGFLVPYREDREYPHFSAGLDRDKLVAIVGRLARCPAERARVARAARADFAPGGRFSVGVRNRALRAVLGGAPVAGERVPA